MQPLIISYSGIRGIAGESLTEEVALQYGHAFGRMVAARHPEPIFLLARDTRPSGPGLLAGIAAGLAPFGRMLDLGVVPTPTLQHAVGALAAHAGVCVTASHNPLPWNGMKFFLAPDNTVLDGDQMRELRALATGSDLRSGAPVIEDRHQLALNLHVERVCEQVDRDRIRTRRFRVAVDSGGGAGQEATLLLLAELGCQVVNVRGRRASEPVPEELSELCRVVAESGCQLGVAQDLDADRLALVTETGHAPGEEMTLVLVVDHLLSRFTGGDRVVVKNTATTRALDDVVARRGAVLVETPVGEVHLSRALLAEVRRGRFACGGEGNGGVIFPPVSPGRDSLMGVALVLEALASDARTLSARLAELPRYHMKKLRVPLPSAGGLAAFMDRIEASAGGSASRLDGLKVSFSDGAWFSIRPSNTEPVVRLVAESRSPGWVEETLRRLEQELTVID